MAILIKQILKCRNSDYICLSFHSLGRPAGVRPTDPENVPGYELPKTPHEVTNEEDDDFTLETEEDKTNGQMEVGNWHLSFSEVKKITNNFRKEIGRGASGSVYIGNFSNGSEVAVKKLSTSSKEALRQFQNEVSFAKLASISN